MNYLVMALIAGFTAGAVAAPDNIPARSIIFTSPAPAGTVNPCAKLMNNCLKMAKNDRLADSFTHCKWEEYPYFFNWAVWGYLSGDSNYKGDPQLLQMTRTWLDRFLSKPPKVDLWFFHYYAIPLLEIMADQEAVGIIGKERLDRYRQFLNTYIKNHAAPAMLKDKLKKNAGYTNILLHEFPLHLVNWRLNGDRDSFEFCRQAVSILASQQLPNGSYPYRYHLYGDSHCEADTMYYHAVTTRGLYLFWQYGNNAEALSVLKKSVPYYPLVLEPPYHFSSGGDIWWKDQWRTFWPQHVAMVAAAARDGENAAIALRMGRDNKGVDWFDPVLGAHAFRLMQEEKIPLRPTRNRYIISDPDIRGLRLRYDDWSCIFTAGSYSFTRISAMITRETTFNALHLARPVFMTRNYDRKAKRISPGVFATLGRYGTKFNYLIDGEVAMACTSYRQAEDAGTWRPNQSEAPFLHHEIWLITSEGLCGFIVSTVERDCEGFEFMHQYRFIAGKSEVSPNGYAFGGIDFNIWHTNFSRRLEERTRRFVYDTSNREDFQIALTDSNRSPENVIQSDDPAAILPVRHGYRKGTTFQSLTSICPAGKGVKKAVLLSGDKIAVFNVVFKKKDFLVAYNFTDQPIRWEIPTAWRTGIIRFTAGQVNRNGDTVEFAPGHGLMIRKERNVD